VQALGANLILRQARQYAHSKASRVTLQYVADLWRTLAKEPAASAIPCITSEGDAGK